MDIPPEIINQLPWLGNIVLAIAGAIYRSIVGEMSKKIEKLEHKLEEQDDLLHEIDTRTEVIRAKLSILEDQ